MGNDLSTPRPWFPGLKPGKLKKHFSKLVLYAMRNFYRIRFHCLCNFFFQVIVGHYVQCVGFKPKELVKHHWSNWMRQTKRPWPLYLKDFWNNMMIDVLCHKWLPFIIKEKYLIPLDVLKWFVIINWNQYIEQFFCTAVRLLWISNFPA